MNDPDPIPTPDELAEGLLDLDLWDLEDMLTRTRQELQDLFADNPLSALTGPSRRLHRRARIVGRAVELKRVQVGL
ncbi:MAG: hypothetical protein ACRDZ1_16795 [Acidimicrobiia bacterium]